MDASASRREFSLADILVEQGWLLPDDRQHVEYLLQRRLKKAGGDAIKPLASMPGEVKVALERIGDPQIHNSLSGVADNQRITTSLQISPLQHPAID